MIKQRNLAEAVFGADAKPLPPEWKQIQEEESLRRQALLTRQKTARMAREAASASEKSADLVSRPKPSRRRN